MTAAEIEEALLTGDWHVTTHMPRICLPGWWECDVLEITAAGFAREFEIKISRGDFFSDAKKEQRVHPPMWDGLNLRMERKHDLLAKGDPRGPSAFWYVTPAGLLKPQEIPSWAGLIEMERRSGMWFGRPAIVAREVKNAPRLHNSKLSEEFIRHVFKTCYYRFHNERETAARLKRVVRKQAEQLRAMKAPIPA